MPGGDILRSRNALIWLFSFLLLLLMLLIWLLLLMMLLRWLSGRNPEWYFPLPCIPSPYSTECVFAFVPIWVNKISTIWKKIKSFSILDKTSFLKCFYLVFKQLYWLATERSVSLVRCSKWGGEKIVRTLTVSPFFVIPSTPTALILAFIPYLFLRHISLILRSYLILFVRIIL